MGRDKVKISGQTEAEEKLFSMQGKRQWREGTDGGILLSSSKAHQMNRCPTEKRGERCIVTQTEEAMNYQCVGEAEREKARYL